MKKLLLCFSMILCLFCGCFILTGCGETEINIKYDLGYEDITQSKTIFAGEKLTKPQNPVREGYEFAGWYENEKLEKEFDFSKPVNKSTTIYADWVSCDLQNLFSWVEVDGGIKLSTVLGGMDTILPKDLVVPRVIDGKKVVELESNLFEGQCYPEPQYELTTVKIPYGVTNIGAYAFNDCYNLESISIPETVTSIGSGAFSFSSSNASILKKVSLPKNLNIISSELFKFCTSLEEIDMPKNYTAIGANAFDGCSKLKNIEFSKEIVTIGDYAFNNCSALEITEVPNKVTEIGLAAFNGCTNNTMTKIPASVRKIGQGAFQKNFKLEYVELPSTVEEMGARIFYQSYCTIIKTNATENLTNWDANWNYGTPTIYDCKNNTKTSGDEYFIQNNCLYKIVEGENEYKYLSLEFCSKTDEVLRLDTIINYNGSNYNVETLSNSCFFATYNGNLIRKLIFNEGAEGAKLTVSATVLARLRNLNTLVLPKSTQPLDQNATYTILYKKNVKTYTTLTAEEVATWTYKADTANEGTYFIPTIYTVGQWQFVNGEPTPIAVE